MCQAFFSESLLKPATVCPPDGSDRCKTRSKEAAAASQRCQIELLVVGLAVFPAAEQNANPFESQGPYRGVVLFRFVAVRLVEGFGPFALGDRLAGKLVEGLAREVLTGVADADPVDLAAANVHGGDAAVALHLEGGLVAFPAGAEGGDESGHGGAARPGKGSEDGGCRDDWRRVRRGGVPSCGDLIAQVAMDSVRWRAFIAPASSTAGSLVAGTAARMASIRWTMTVLAVMVLAKERAQGAIVAALQVLQIGPALEQVGYQRSIHVEPLHQLRKILLQAILQAQRQAGLVVHQLATVFDQHQQQASVGRHRARGGGDGRDGAAAGPESNWRHSDRLWRRRARRSSGRRPTWTRARGTAPGARRAEAGSRPILASVPGRRRRAGRRSGGAGRRPRPRSLRECCRRSPRCGLPPPAGWRIQACFWLPQSRATNAAQAGSGVVLTVSDMCQIPFQRGWLGSGESLIVESRNGKLLRIRFWNQAHPAARTAPRRHRTARRRNS